MKQLTVGLIAGPHRDQAHRALDSLLKQSMADNLRVHVVDFAADAGPLVTEGSGVQAAVAPADWLIGRARAEVVRHADTPLVGFLEEHCVAETAWAQALVDAHRDPRVAAAAGVITNLDAEPLLARIAALCSYRASLPPIARLDAEVLFGQNVCYKRADLMAFDDCLDLWLTTELLLFRALLTKQRRLVVASAARFQHAGLARYRDVLHGVYHYHRAAHGIARDQGSRSGPGGYAKTLLSAPARTMKTIGTEIRIKGFPCATLLTLPWVVLIHASAALGQLLGRSRGPGCSPISYSRSEIVTQRTALRSSNP